MELSHDIKTRLIESAAQVRRWAYAPYSKYAVGAALLSDSGKIYDGVNIESAAYPTSICAERVAYFKAVSEGERNFQAIAVVTENGGYPCGACRQVMAEFGLDTVVMICNAAGEVLEETTVGGLLPGAFTPDSLIRG